MTKSKIEWTNRTWPVVTGCAPVSPGCKHCYAARMAATRLKHHPRYKGLAAMAMPGRFGWTGKVNLNHDVLEQPLRWKKPCMIFVAPMGDLFHGNVPLDYIADVFNIMARCRQHTFQILTKRPCRARVVISDLHEWNRADTTWTGIFPSSMTDAPFPLPNVHLGVSVENQATADERREYLQQMPATVRFVSYEPALGPVDWTGWEFVDQIISGGESGPQARPSYPNWHRETRDFCQRNNIAYFMKQWGAWFPRSQWEDNPDLILPDDDCCVEGRGCKLIDDDVMHRVGKRRAGRLLDGVLHEEYPK